MQMVLARPYVAGKEVVKPIRRLTKELLGYLNYNRDSLPKYGQQYSTGKRISSAFIEWAVNQLIYKRKSKSQQMRWARSVLICCCNSERASLTECFAMTLRAGTETSHPTPLRLPMSLDRPHQIERSHSSRYEKRALARFTAQWTDAQAVQDVQN